MLEGAGGGAGKLGDTLIAFVGIAGNERVDIANFEFSINAIAVFFDSIAAVDASSALEIAEGFAQSLVAATQDPVDDFAFAHDIKVVHREIAAELHRFDDVSDKLEGGAGAIIMIIRKEREGRIGEFFGNFEVTEAKLVDAVFITENGDIVGKTTDLVERPGIIKEVAVTEGIFETVDGETRNIIVDKWVDLAIGNFTGEDTIFFQLAHNGARIADDFASAAFDRFLLFAVAIFDVDAMLKGGSGDIMEEGGKRSLLVMGEAPSEKSDANAMSEDGMEILESIETSVIPATSHADATEALHVGSGDVLQEPGRKFWRKQGKIFTGV